MRILAIRGCNLASLAGEFEIDLARGPLGAAGVFAIVGNTGAGKSTLLDALCVALFDRTPRLTNHSRVQVGRGDDDPHALGALDVRTLLRRGASSGWAEVEFESGDGRSYRAKWSVRRARGQADGVLQAQQITLTALDGQRIGGTKTETLEAIHARLGLSFDQFRRSALLAQGEFAAFLRADGKDRSELLERMTGTEIYSRLSMQAHLMMTLAEQRLTSDRTAALAIAVLDEDSRLRIGNELRFAEAAKTAARARFTAAHVAARWLTDAASRTQAVEAATVAHAAATHALLDAEPLRREVAMRRRAESLRATWEHAQRAEHQATLAAHDEVGARATHERSIAALAESHARRGELTDLLAPVRAARIASGLVERSPAATAPAGTFTQLLAVGRAAVADAEWLTVHAPLGAEVATWSELEGKLASYATGADALTALARTIAEHTEQRTKIAASCMAITVEVRAVSDKHGEAQRKADSFSKKRGLTLDAARRAEDSARKRRSEVESLVAVAAGARSARAALVDLQRQLADLVEMATTDATARTHNESAKQTAIVLRIERQRVVAELRKAAGYSHARAELVDHEPCPLCGAEEHPWRDRGALDEVIVSADSDLAAAGSQLDAAVNALATLDARAHQREVDRVRLERQREASQATLAAAAPTWTEQLQALGELSLVRDPSSVDAEQVGAELLAVAGRALDAARATRSQTEAATKAAADAQAEVALCQTSLDAVTGRARELDRKLADLDATIGRLDGERVSRSERHAELFTELSTAIARWTVAADPVSNGTGALDPVNPRTRTWLAEVAQTWRARAETVSRAEAALVQALGAAQTDVQASERTTTELAARLEECTKRAVELSNAAGVAAGELATAMSMTGDEAAARAITETELRDLLAVGPSRVEELAAQLARIERAAETSATIVSERRRTLDEHLATRPAEVDALTHASDDEHLPSSSAINAQLSELAKIADSAEQHAASLGAAIAADTDARARRETALAQIAVAEGEAHVDRVLGQMLGSHDGKKFRSFAQSLTLDGLLSVANSHLEELAPRYQLERVPRHDLELQVIDRDLGNEVRSVQSLSGGESFLVSLALALGLSSMSAHDVRVRTLLIDEGFGTLDPATLEMALSVLEALRQQGRQVGVISHVPQLVERVGAHVRVIARGGGRSEVVVA